MSANKGIHLSVNLSGKESNQSPSPSSQLGTRLPIQDYEKLRRNHLMRGDLFEDPYFPADASSLFHTQTLPFTPKWLRPTEIVSKPELFTGGASRFDVAQGMLGDCWLVAAIASLTQDKKLLNKVIPSGQDFKKGYTGIFHFNFWHFGQWVDVVVDDRLPTHNGKLIFIHSTEDTEFWSALLEKAYAKLYGGYEALKGGKTSEAMVDFTGGVVESFQLAKCEEDLFKRMQKGAKAASLMSCSIAVTGKADIEAKLSSGLVKGHAYSVTSAKEVQVKGKSVRLVRIRNPWGQKEWNGDWSDNSATWKTVSASVKKELEVEAGEDGEFWMSYEDMKKHFTDFEMCSVSIDELYEDDAVKNWNSLVLNGAWDESRGTAGGCRNFPTFANNPQYIVDLTEDDDGDGKSSCLIALMQKNRRKQKKMGVQDLCIGFSVYKAPTDGSKKLTKQYVDYNYSSGNSGSFTNAREVQKRFDLDPGTYVILPCAFKPGEEGEYLLRVFTEKSSKKPEGMTQMVSVDKASRLRAMFDRLAGSDGEIDSEELQDLLTASLSKDISRGSVFSIDACRSMIAMLDWDKNGTLNFAEFETLLETIARWKKMFYKFDRDRSGVLEKQEVHQALTSLGYSMTQNSFLILFNRFAVRRKYMKLDDFAACLCRVKIMNDTFEKLNDYKSGGSIKLSQEEFFNITLDA